MIEKHLGRRRYVVLHRVVQRRHLHTCGRQLNWCRMEAVRAGKWHAAGGAGLKGGGDHAARL